MRPRSTRAEAARRPALTVDQSGHATPLVLVHGLATSRRIWAPVVTRLAQRRRVVALDVPGFGTSLPAGLGFDLDAVSERVVRAIAAHGVQAPFDLSGHALGGAVALTLAARRPKLVSRLVLVAPAGFEPVNGRDLQPLLTQARAPLGLIWGERDRTIPASAARVLLDARPDCRLELIPGAGHAPMAERPAEFVTALERLLRSLPRSATTPHRRALNWR